MVVPALPALRKSSRAEALSARFAAVGKGAFVFFAAKGLLWIAVPWLLVKLA